MPTPTNHALSECKSILKLATVNLHNQIKEITSTTLAAKMPATWVEAEPVIATAGRAGLVGSRSGINPETRKHCRLQTCKLGGGHGHSQASRARRNASRLASTLFDARNFRSHRRTNSPDSPRHPATASPMKMAKSRISRSSIASKRSLSLMRTSPHRDGATGEERGKVGLTI